MDPQNEGGNLGSGGPTGYQQFNEDAPEYKMAAAKEKKKSWALWIKILGFVLIIIGGIGVVTNALELITKIGSLGSTPSIGDFGSVGSTTGLSDVVMKVLDILASLLLMYQGWLMYKTTKKDTAEATTGMRRNIIIFAVLYILIRVIQLLIVLVMFILSGDSEEVSKVEMTEEELEIASILEDGETALNSVVYIFVGGSALATCFCVTCYCGMVYFAHGKYKTAQETYETAERNLNVGSKAPVIDHSQNQNKMV